MGIADNVVQESLWHLSESDLSNASVSDAMDNDLDQATADARALTRALRTVISVVSENLAQ